MTDPVCGVQSKQEKETYRSNSINAHFLKAIGPSCVLGLFLLFCYLNFMGNYTLDQHF